MESTLKRRLPADAVEVSTVTLDELAKHNTPTDCWVSIDGIVYDVTKFLDQHPGGHFNILSAGGMDCTGTFRSLHEDWVLSKALPKQTVVGRLAPHDNNVPFPKFDYTDDFSTELRHRIQEEFKTRKLAKRDGVRVWSETLLILGLFLVCHATVPFLAFTRGWDNLSWCQRLAPAILTGCLGSLVGMNVMHAANHGGLTSNPTLRWMLEHSLDLVGGGAARWKVSHNLQHHQFTNTPNDPDQQFMPFLRLHPDNPRLWHYCLQHLYYPLLMIINFASWEFRDTQFLWDSKHRWSEKVLYSHLLWSGLHKIIFYVIPSFVYGSFLTAFALCFFEKVVASVILVTMFLVSHNNHELESLTLEDLKEVKTVSWSAWQVRTSQNWCAGSVVANFLSGGLNHQIEHHIFPSIHHCHYPWMAPVVREVCAKHGVSYLNHPTFGAAFASLIKTLRHYGVQACG